MYEDDLQLGELKENCLLLKLYIVGIYCTLVVNTYILRPTRDQLQRLL